MKIFDLFLHHFLVRVSSINGPQRLIVLRMDLSGNDQITTALVPEETTNKDD